MQIRLLIPMATIERGYSPGDIADMPTDEARRMIADGAAEEMGHTVAKLRKAAKEHGYVIVKNGDVDALKRLAREHGYVLVARDG